MVLSAYRWPKMLVRGQAYAVEILIALACGATNGSRSRVQCPSSQSLQSAGCSGIHPGGFRRFRSALALAVPRSNREISGSRGIARGCWLWPEKRTPHIARPGRGDDVMGDCSGIAARITSRPMPMAGLLSEIEDKFVCQVCGVAAAPRSGRVSADQDEHRLGRAFSN